MPDPSELHEGEGPPPDRKGSSRRSLLLYAMAAAAVGAATVTGGSRAVAVGASDTSHPSYPESTSTASQRAFSVQATTYPNGQIPPSELVFVGVSTLSLGNQYLVSDAAASYRALGAAYQAALGKPMTLAEGYRDLQRQQYLWDGWNAKKPGFNQAAQPGTSIHGLGRAVDFSGGVNNYGTAEKNWMNANGPRFGWQPKGDGFASREPWHFEYDGSYNPIPTPDPTITEDDEMYVIKNTTTGHVFVAGKHYVRHLGTTADASLVSRVVSASDEIHELNAAQTSTIFIALGIPRSYVDPTRLPHGGASGWWSIEDQLLTQAGGSVSI